MQTDIKAKIAGISKLMEEIAIPSFKLWKSHLCIESFSDFLFSLIQFWSTEVVLSGIKSVPENEFKSLGD